MGGTSKDFNRSNRKSINFGYVILPDDSDRDSYVRDCFNRGVVSILVEDGGGVIHDVDITEQVIRDIIFPTQMSELGSFVCFFTEPFGNRPFVLGTFTKNNQVNTLKENTHLIQKGSEGSSSLIHVGDDGVINIDVYGNNNLGVLNININNSSGTGKLNVNAKGDINIDCEGSIKVKNIGGDISVETEKNIYINAAKYVLNGGNEVPLLGNKTTEQLDKEKQALSDLIDKISQLNPIPVPPGSVDATWAALKVAIKSITDRADYTDIKSKEIFFK